MADKQQIKSEVTIEDLRKQYPEQVADIEAAARKKVVDDFVALEPHQIQDQFPAVFRKLQTPVIKGFNLDSGFIVGRDDPYGAGVARDYANAKGCERPAIPAILPWGEKATVTALRSYLLRAKGAGDVKRADAALATIGKYAPGVLKEIQESGKKSVGK